MIRKLFEKNILNILNIFMKNSIMKIIKLYLARFGYKAQRMSFFKELNPKQMNWGKFLFIFTHYKLRFKKLLGWKNMGNLYWLTWMI